MCREVIYVTGAVRSRLEFAHAGPDLPAVQIEGVVRKGVTGEEKYGFTVEGAAYLMSGTLTDIADEQLKVSRLLFDYLVATGVIRRSR